MKTLSTLLLVALFACFFSANIQKTSAQIPTNGLVAWYPMNGNANDESGNGHHGTVIGATLSPDRFGHPDSAYFFNGSSQIEVSTNSAFELNDCSFSVWVRVSTTAPEWQTILAKYDINFQGAYTLAVHYNRINIWMEPSTGGEVTFDSNTILALNTWYHVTVTHSSLTGIKMYINGIFDAQSTAVFNMDAAAGQFFRIGAQGSFLPIPLSNGNLDDIRIYNLELPDQDVFSLYTEFACTQTIFDTLTTNITVYDTITTQVTVYDTLTTNITVYDTILTSVMDTLIINALLTGQLPPNNVSVIKLYPTPASDFLQIEIPSYSLMNGYSMRVDNSLSQVVYQTAITQSAYSINLSGWTGNGLYFFYLIDSGGNTIEVKKIVLQ